MSNNDLGVLPASQRRAQLGASVLLMSSPAATQRGIAMSGAVSGAGACAVAMHAVRRPASALGATQFGQPATNIQTHIEKQYVTSVNADGVGAAGPPRKREPA